ncbi:beta-1,6-N-acetylglucosaminyltransferase [Mucilaginibacter sp. CSA2-8R]|uniref:beta-1,6-N-acetylglucosaminyltransferase n=1 Tax=Mucilaginibacter sp. CSA2-8R TaxID=3141542 RepID=UPI00315DF24B
MKIAHLILAHKNPEQVAALIESLQHPAFDFYVHVDKKTDITPFALLFNESNVRLLHNRAKIYWGEWGTIQATLNGFQDILPGQYNYINVISGQDFPIKSAEFIYEYFCNNRGTEFITCDPVKGGDWGDVSSRVEDYHFINWRIPGKHSLGKLATKLFPKRRFPLNYKVVGRANWFALTTDAVSYVLHFIKGHPQVSNYFRYCWGADEFIFSTILYNSRFKDQIQPNLLYVDWSGADIGHSRLLGVQDMANLKVSEKLFARKFDLEGNPPILAMLKKLVVGRSESFSG